MDAGDWRAAEALIDRIYGRAGQAVAMGAEQLEPGDTVEIRRLLLETLSVTKSDTPPA